MWQAQLLLPLSERIHEVGLIEAMDKQREEDSIALPKALWDDLAIRAKTFSCGIYDIIQRAHIANDNAPAIAIQNSR